MRILDEHTAELSSSIWNFDNSLIATSSLDATARIWDMRSTQCLHLIDEHTNEILDVAFDYAGRRISTASADYTSRVWDITSNLELQAIMAGHTDEVSKV